LTELNSKILDEFVKTLKGKLPSVQVGILGDKTHRGTDNPDGLTNAQIGAWHEFGTSKLPVRSFLRLPLTTQLERYLEKSGAFSKDAVKEVLEQRSIVPWLMKIGVLAEQIVADAFASGGFGTWVPSNMKFKKVHMTLVETQQLRNSITSRIKT
jgi:hypothetical protein